MLEILNAAGQTVRRYSSADPVTAFDPATSAVMAEWQRRAESLSAAAGMHRFVWDFRPQPPAGGGGRGGGGRGGQPALAPGSYSVRLTANGQSYTQPLIVKPDPRVK
jgi:hypothetical protein